MLSKRNMQLQSKISSHLMNINGFDKGKIINVTFISNVGTKQACTQSLTAEFEITAHVRIEKCVPHRSSFKLCDVFLGKMIIHIKSEVRIQQGSQFFLFQF